MTRIERIEHLMSQIEAKSIEVSILQQQVLEIEIEIEEDFTVERFER